MAFKVASAFIPRTNPLCALAKVTGPNCHLVPMARKTDALVLSSSLTQQLFNAVNVHAHSPRFPEIQALIKAGALVNMKDSRGLTPLMIAYMNQNTELYRLLKEHGGTTGCRALDSAIGNRYL